MGRELHGLLQLGRHLSRVLLRLLWRLRELCLSLAETVKDVKAAVCQLGEAARRVRSEGAACCPLHRFAA